MAFILHVFIPQASGYSFGMLIELLSKNVTPHENI
jgi:hypothetical protein